MGQKNIISWSYFVRDHFVKHVESCEVAYTQSKKGGIDPIPSGKNRAGQD